MSEFGQYTPSPSPSSSPSLAPIDSSPPLSPSSLTLHTPPASPGAKDPFAGSTKSSKRPRIYERHEARRLSENIQPFYPIVDKADDASDVLTRAHNDSDATPTRVIDPFSASAKPTWRPPIHEKKGRVSSADSATSASSSTLCPYDIKSGPSPNPAGRGVTMTIDDLDDDLILSEDEFDRAKARGRRETKEQLEHRLWDEAITAPIDKGVGVIDLAWTSLGKGPISHIPPSIGDLERFVGFSQTHVPTSAPSSPKHSSNHLPPPSVLPYHANVSSRAFTRASTLPAAAFNDNFFLKSKDGERLRGTPAARAASLQSVPQPSSTRLRRREIKLFLANNTISCLPLELFRVSSLTVLSLRSNALTVLPPQISQLTSLQELNVAQNNLHWIPAEMMDMRLVKLVLTGNPWLPPPLSVAESVQDHPQTMDKSLRRQCRIPVSAATVHCLIPPLKEMCFRTLFAPYSTHATPYMPTSLYARPTSPTSAFHHTGPDDASTANSTGAMETSSPPRPLTVLEAFYALPLTEDLGLEPSVLATFRACVPVAVAKLPIADHLSGPTKIRRDEGQRDVHSLQTRDKDIFGTSHPSRPMNTPEKIQSLDEDEPSISICPSPAHHGQARTPVFVRPAEERFTWEEVVAGVRVGAEGVGGAGIPVRWRGCGRGCLAFLDHAPESVSRTAGVAVSDATSDDAADVPEEEDVDVEMSEGGSQVDMQEVRFEGRLADPDDFEEGF
ncbi:hypothetical protein BC628DRAFT_1423632 [Trametes gibbosa]|nr:hypothetical protein BC628DRAFT_1423632 [Trametes gibbosa]